jgi:hypothetical protein
VCQRFRNIGGGKYSVYELGFTLNKDVQNVGFTLNFQVQDVRVANYLCDQRRGIILKHIVPMQGRNKKYRTDYSTS